MEQRDTHLDEELRRGAHYLARRLTPTAGTIPRIPGIDGLIEPVSAYTQDQLEQAVSRAKEGTAQMICDAIVRDRQAAAPQADDLTLVVIKYR